MKWCSFKFKWLCILCSALLFGCGGGDGDDNDNDDGGDQGAENKVQVDREGRPGVNTVLISSGTKDAYNSNNDPNTWAPQFQAEIATSLTVVDRLDGVPGNALLGDNQALAGILVDDRLTIDTDHSNCDAYLAVELGVANDCGGRTLKRDVIDDTLTALVGSPVSDNVANDSAFLNKFPFVGPANGNQLDREGRPGVNTVLISSNLKNAYNAATERATWPSLFQDEIAANLTVVDGLDGEIGNALLGDSQALAGVLVDDVLIIDTSIANCDAYLAVELGIADSCGGRTLERDVIDDTLTALVGVPVSDNVANDSTFLAQFPFLGDPN